MLLVLAYTMANILCFRVFVDPFHICQSFIKSTSKGRSQQPFHGSSEAHHVVIIQQWEAHQVHVAQNLSLISHDPSSSPVCHLRTSALHTVIQ